MSHCHCSECEAKRARKKKRKRKVKKPITRRRMMTLEEVIPDCILVKDKVMRGDLDSKKEIAQAIRQWIDERLPKMDEKTMKDKSRHRGKYIDIPYHSFDDGYVSGYNQALKDVADALIKRIDQSLGEE